MDLDSIFRESSAEERLATYRSRGIPHALLLVPFNTLSRLAKEASLQLAREWGREIAGIERMRIDVEHAEDSRTILAGAWLLSVSRETTHPVDGFYWINETKLWAQREQSDPRLDAFSEGYSEAAQALPPVRPPSSKCRCGTCRSRGRTRVAAAP
jgi:hypothetical protein